MSEIEFKAPRPIEQIQQEYNNTAAQVGDLSYRIRLDTEALTTSNSKLSQLLDKMKLLAREAAAIKAVEAAAPPGLPAETPPPPVAS